jgi:hypothetical protein
MYLGHSNTSQRQRLGQAILSESSAVALLHVSHSRSSQTALLYHGQGIRVLDRSFGELQCLPRVAPSDEKLCEAIGGGRIFLVCIERSLDVLEARGETGAALVFCGLQMLTCIESFNPQQQLGGPLVPVLNLMDKNRKCDFAARTNCRLRCQAALALSLFPNCH